MATKKTRGKLRTARRVMQSRNIAPKRQAQILKHIRKTTKVKFI